jgi:iron complex outermembrane receptor protein
LAFCSRLLISGALDAKLSGYHAEIIYETDAGVLTVIPAYREQEQDSLFGGPGFASGWWDNSAEQTTLEVRFQGESDTVDYLVGAFYFEEDTKGDNTFNQEFVLPLQDYTMSSDSWAAFAELTWKLSDTSRLITGARYTDDSRDIDGKIENFIVFCGGIPPTPPPGSFGLGCAVPGNLPHFPTFDTPAQAEAYLVDNGYVVSAAIGPPKPLTSGTGVVLHSFASNQQSYASDEVTWRVVYEQDILSDSLFYASFATGYRAGGLEPTGNTFDPEYLDAYTIGLKNRFLDGSLQLNLELFRWEYTDQQISYFRVVGETLENTADNVGQATNQGLDIDLLWAASDSTLIRSKVQLLDNSYDDLHFSTSPPRHNINCPSTVVGSLASGAPIFDFNCSGNQSIYSPDVTVQFGIEHTIDMSGYNLVLGVDTTYVDDQVTGFQNLEHEVIESHWMTNADITLASQSAPWSVTAYARNLEDERRALSSQTPLLGMAIVRHGPDMTYGVRFNYEF